jgi:1,2-diacylglycerol 3-alpha-glucosyltransferase
MNGLRKLKVLITSSSYLPNIGGIENSLYYLARAGKDDDVTIVTGDKVSKINGNDYRIPLNCRIIKYKSKISRNSFLNAIYIWVSAFKAYRQIALGGCDVVITRYHFNTLLCYLAGLRNIKFLVPGLVKHQASSKNLNKLDSSIKSRLSYLYNQLIQYIAFRVSDEIYVFSTSMAEQVKSVYGKCKIIREQPGVDTERFAFTANKSIESINLLVLSRLNHAKNIEMAIEAISYLPEIYRLKIVGDGPILNQLIELTARLNLVHRIIFEGSHTEVVKFYAEAHLFLLPSVYEPFGQTILEASSCGVPTVSFDQSLVDTATNDILCGFGTYAIQMTAFEYAKAIKYAYSSYYLLQERSRLDLRNFICARYTWDGLYFQITGRH